MRTCKVSASSLLKYLGPPKFRYGTAETEPQIGVATGLAWTELGGELLSVEVTIVPGRGKLTITGQLGEVMQESAQAATVVRALTRGDAGPCAELLPEDRHPHSHSRGRDPQGRPVGGNHLATSLVSALCRVQVRNDMAMTGEITLRGRVLPIGGLKEKVLAAHRGGIKTVLIPGGKRERRLRHSAAGAEERQLDQGRPHGRGASACARAVRPGLFFKPKDTSAIDGRPLLA